MRDTWACRKVRARRARRETRSTEQKIRWAIWRRDVWLFIITVLVFWSLLAITNETEERRDQNCLTFERDHRADIRTHRSEVEDYRELLRYVEDIPAGERDTQLNQAIIRSVPERRADLDMLRDEVRSSQPPAYCDKPGVGLENG